MLGRLSEGHVRRLSLSFHHVFSPWRIGIERTVARFTSRRFSHLTAPSPSPSPSHFPPGRPRLLKFIEHALQRAVTLGSREGYTKTQYAREKDEALGLSGLVVGVCGPVGLGDEVATVVGGVDATRREQVVLFDHTVRGQAGQDLGKELVSNSVHVGQSSSAAIARIHHHLPAEEVPELLAGRFQFINLWYPVRVPAVDWPLAMCDYRSVDSVKDPVIVKLVYKEYTGEMLGVNYNKDHKWKYLHAMTPEEIVLIKCYDSVQDGSIAAFTPHTGFKDLNAPEGVPPREPIEVRTVAFYD